LCLRVLHLFSECKQHVRALNLASRLVNPTLFKYLLDPILQAVTSSKQISMKMLSWAASQTTMPFSIYTILPHASPIDIKSEGHIIFANTTPR